MTRQPGLGCLCRGFLVSVMSVRGGPGSRGIETRKAGAQWAEVRRKKKGKRRTTHLSLCPTKFWQPRPSPLRLWAAGGQGAAADAAGNRGGFVAAGAQAGSRQWDLGWAWSRHPHLLW